MALGGGVSDMFKMLAAVGAYEYEPTHEFCERNFLRAKGMQEIHQLRTQISNIAKLPRANLLPPTDTQVSAFLPTTVSLTIAHSVSLPFNSSKSFAKS